METTGQVSLSAGKLFAIVAATAVITASAVLGGVAIVSRNQAQPVYNQVVTPQTPGANNPTAPTPSPLPQGGYEDIYGSWTSYEIKTERNLAKAELRHPSTYATKYEVAADAGAQFYTCCN